MKPAPAARGAAPPAAYLVDLQGLDPARVSDMGTSAQVDQGATSTKRSAQPPSQLGGPAAARGFLPVDAGRGGAHLLQDATLESVVLKRQTTRGLFSFRAA